MRKVAFLTTVWLLAAWPGPGASVKADDFFRCLFGGKHVEGSGQAKSETRTVESFEEIELSGAYDVFVTIGPEQKVELTFDDNLIDLIRTQVRGHSLRIFSKESYSSDLNCRVDITVPKLEAVSCSGSGDIDVSDLKGELFEFDLSGSGGLRVDGLVDKLEVSVSGSGDVDARELIAKDVYCSVSGSGNIRVHADSSLDGSVSGSGDISYYGSPEHISTHVSGSGRIHKRR
jgi:hypothetical protein